ncbi:MAG TPA: cytochrome P450, partial [Chthonomonadaceae bacterium]|nr:cytochrome P450 [Chthonomonadaceae bacterium]
HRSRRRLLSPVLRREPFVPKVAAIREIALCATAKWPVGELFSPKPSLQEITFQVMVQLLLGNLESEAGQALIAAYRDSVLRQVGSWGPWRNFARLQPQIRALLAGEIQARRADPDRPGALTALAQARAEDGQPITDAEWEDHVFSLLVAGVDTTALSLTWALYWLSREEGAWAKMLEAIEGTPETGNTDLLEQPYLSAFFSEVLRMIPIVTTPSGRRLTRCVQIGPHRFPAGVTLVPCTYLVHRREDLYPDSGRFRPERFLERQYAAWEFFPFGGGARACLGGTLAEIEFKTVLTTILSRWEVHAKEAPPLPPIRHGTLLAPPEPFQVVARPISSARKGACA